MKAVAAASLLPEKKKGPKRQASRLQQMADRVRDIMNAPKPDDWVKATPELFVGLFAVLHQRVYGVFPDYLADEFAPALSSAKRCLNITFKGDGVKMAKFMNWAWLKEREEFKKDPEKDFLIGWKWQFSPKFVNRYLIRTQKKKI